MHGRFSAPKPASRPARKSAAKKGIRISGAPVRAITSRKVSSSMPTLTLIQERISAFRAMDPSPHNVLERLNEQIGRGCQHGHPAPAFGEEPAEGRSTPFRLPAPRWRGPSERHDLQGTSASFRTCMGWKPMPHPRPNSEIPVRTSMDDNLQHFDSRPMPCFPAPCFRWRGRQDRKRAPFPTQSGRARDAREEAPPDDFGTQSGRMGRMPMPLGSASLLSGRSPKSKDLMPGDHFYRNGHPNPPGCRRATPGRSAASATSRLLRDLRGSCRGPEVRS
jgi:hypothetical protein